MLSLITSNSPNGRTDQRGPTVRRARSAIAAVLVGAVAAALALASTPAQPAVAASSVTITSTYGTNAGTFSGDQLLNGSQGGYNVTKNLHLNPMNSGKYASAGLRQVRVDHMFDDDFYHVASRDSSGNLQFDFTKLDAVVLPLFKQGMKPFFCLSYTPGVMGSKKFASPTNLTDWSSMVQATVAHYKTLGYTGLNWEVWNEPDGDFWTSGQQSFDNLYAASAQAVKNADSTAQIGGPAPYNVNSSFMSGFLDYIAANPTVPFDFVSWHDYGGTDFSSATSVANMLSTRKIPAKKEYITEWNLTPAFGTAPGGTADTNALASYAARRMTTAISQPNLSGVFFFSPIEGYNPTADFSTDLGLYTIDEHRKAVANVFDMINQMPSTVLQSTVSGAPTDRSVGAVATGDSTAKSAAFLAWNDGSDTSTVQLNANSLPYGSSNFKVTRYDVGASAGNYYSTWAAGTKNLAVAANEYLRPSGVSVAAPSSSWTANVSMPANSVVLYVLTPTTDATGSTTITAPPTTADVARGTTVTSSSSYTGGGWSPANLVDGRRHTYDESDANGITQGFTSVDHATANATEWVQTDLGAAKSFDTVTLWPRDDQAADGASFPVDFTIAGSNDGSTWSTLTTKTGYKAGTAVSGPQVFSVGSQTYRYLRVTATKLGLPVTEGTSSVYRLQLAELEVNQEGLANPGFESGDLSSWSVEGSASVSTDAPFSGNDAATFTGAGRGVFQVVSGLQPNTTYTFGGFLKSGSASEPVYLGVKNYGGTEKSVPVTSTAYKQAWVQFTTGANSTSALVYVYKNSGTAQAWFDDAVLAKQ
ncbi:hypothetical protein NS263_06650 [Curtobacterium oceanosedimentum]|uniref:F5/8 type C domain-containing protein n=1 Tax=Curtobacterium oceanosedimentum TaxID=465820 RepID=A0ABR5S747_9MICO|nr:discoidin domain-containing protein [Curtobacterium oceanosedimentum]KTR40732.1 hypothetical protein NS263_06650 [Curtobacterium oceanosedimentum]